jgi:hypothetical protein
MAVTVELTDDEKAALAALPQRRPDDPFPAISSAISS